MKKELLTIILSLVVWMTGTAQFTIGGKSPSYDSRTNSYLLPVPESAYESYAYQVQVDMDATVEWVKIDQDVFMATDEVRMVRIPYIDQSTTYALSYCQKGTVKSAELRFTFFPVLHLKGTFDGDSYKVGTVEYTGPEDTVTTVYSAKLKWAGNTTNRPWFHKHNFHIKFLDANGDKMDVKFGDLRNDNHWRLDAGMVDMGRIRNKCAHELWAAMDVKPYYADVQPKARTYVRGLYMEVFLNNTYMGFFNMAENMDRKQMKLKKYDDVNFVFHGMLWKGKEVTDQTLFTANAEYDNTLDNWGGFDLKYPDLEDVNPTDYSVLSNAIEFVATSSDDEFVAQVGNYFDLPALVNYYLFIQMIYGVDNTCKNLLWGCYDSATEEGRKLTPAVWDLDATCGQFWSNANSYYRTYVVAPETDLDMNPWCYLNVNTLYIRLLKIPSFKLQVYNQYWRYRDNVFHPDSLVARFADNFAILRKCGALDRETERWSGDTDISSRTIDFEEEFGYLRDWFRRRSVYLDTIIFDRILGDVDGDKQVNINDVQLLIDYLLEVTDDIKYLNADYNCDDSIDINDVQMMIDALLE